MAEMQDVARPSIGRRKSSSSSTRRRGHHHTTAGLVIAPGVPTVSLARASGSWEALSFPTGLAAGSSTVGRGQTGPQHVRTDHARSDGSDRSRARRRSRTGSLSLLRVNGQDGLVGLQPEDGSKQGNGDQSASAIGSKDHSGNPKDNTISAASCRSVALQDNPRLRDKADLSSLMGTPKHDRSAIGLDVELNTVSLQYLKKMLAQLLQQAGIADPETWEKQILSLLLEISCKVLPDIRAGDAIDIRHYVKLKRIAGGAPKDCEYIDGMVFAQNVVHRKMSRSIKNPRILLLAFDLEYQKVDDKLLNLEAINSQERDYLTHLVSRIKACRPHLLLTNKSISRIAIDMLLDAHIVAFRNVKISVMQAVARCTQAQIIPSIDRLATHSKLGRCGLFTMRTFQHDFAISGKRSYAFIEDCPPNLGATIILRGDTIANLKPIKTTVDFMTAVVYHLKLESLLMRDQYAMIRSNPVIDPDIFSGGNEVGVSSNRSAVSQATSQATTDLPQLMQRLHGNSHMTFGSDVQTALDDYIHLSSLLLSCSPSVRRQMPKLLTQIILQLDQWISSFDTSTTSSGADTGAISRQSVSAMSCAEEIQYLLSEWLHYRSVFISTTPMDHQSLIVLHSRRSMLTSRPCFPPITDTIAFYGESDKSLGQFIEDNHRNARAPCSAPDCDKPMLMHYLHYAHDRAVLTIVTEEQVCPLPGMEDVILMWSYCKFCGKTTLITPMSEDAWRFSFGKYLELSLYDSQIRPRADICPHLLYKDHVRFFAFRNLTARFQTEAIKPWRIALPHKHLLIDTGPHVTLLKEDLTSTRQKSNRYWLSLQMRLDSYDGVISSGNFASIGESDLKIAKESALQDAKECIDALNVLEHIESFEALQKGLNIVRRSMQDKVVMWDVRLTAFERLILPQEIDMHRLSSSQIKKFFGAVEAPESGTSSRALVREKGSFDGRVHSNGPDKKATSAVRRSSLLSEAESGGVSSDKEQGDPVQSTGVDLIDKTLSNALSAVVIANASEDEPDSKSSSLISDRMPGGYLTNSALSRRKKRFRVPSNEVQVFDNMTEAVKDESEPESLSGDDDDLAFLKFAASQRWQREQDYRRRIGKGRHTQKEASEEDSKDVSGVAKIAKNAEEGPGASALNDLLTLGGSSVTERPSLLKSISNLWPFKLTGFSPLDYPLGPQEHLFTHSSILVREDEPSSILAFTLASLEYSARLESLHEASWSKWKSMTSQASSTDLNDSQSQSESEWLEYVLKKPTTLHIRSHFQDATSKMSCKVFFAEQFSALRKACRCEETIISSLSRCVKWESSGGKSGSTFLKSQDDRLIMKELSRPEMDAFTRFAPAYFEYMTQAFFHGLPTILAKIFGFFRVSCKNSMTGKTFKLDVLVMENLFFGRRLSKIYDLKGSIRNRHIHSTGKENEVLLDENLIETMFHSPLYVDNHSKKSLRASLWNDTLFLSKANVMDYSLVVGLDEDKGQAVAGIVDFIRTYTWDKKLESWVKENALLGGGRGEPTIVTPKSYKIRFREAMERYFVLIPDCWTKRDDIAPWQPEAPIPITAESDISVIP